MKSDRFRSIYFVLHVNDNGKYIPRGQPNHDHIHKIRLFFVHFIKCFKGSFYLGESMTIDEGMCPFRVRINFRVYIKYKPNKYGINLFAAQHVWVVMRCPCAIHSPVACIYMRNTTVYKTGHNNNRHVTAKITHTNTLNCQLPNENKK